MPFLKQIWTGPKLVTRVSCTSQFSWQALHPTWTCPDTRWRTFWILQWLRTLREGGWLWILTYRQSGRQMGFILRLSFKVAWLSPTGAHMCKCAQQTWTGRRVTWATMSHWFHGVTLIAPWYETQARLQVAGHPQLFSGVLQSLFKLHAPC